MMSKLHNRWCQLIFGIFCMGLIANLQYSWTLFVPPIASKTNWSMGAIQLSFTIFILVETWLVPVEGWLVDRYGPSVVIKLGSVLAALGWVINGYADSLTVLYAGAVLSGIGAGCVYGTCVGNALKWFPDKRGLAAGLTAAGFGAGAALTVIPIGLMIQNSGYEHTFIFFGILQGLLIFGFSLFMIKPVPPSNVQISPRIISNKRNYKSAEMMKTPLFWLIYLLFTVVAAGGLLVTAQIAPMAKDFGIANNPFLFLGATIPLITMTLSIDNLCNGFTRPLCGFFSDHFGRENTMFFVFIGEGLSMLGLVKFGHDPYAFMFFAACVFLFWGEIFSIFPALCADTFGVLNSACNSGTLYTAKGTASLLIPIASIWIAKDNWEMVITIGTTLSVCAGLAAKFLLEPMRKDFIKKDLHSMITQGALEHEHSSKAIPPLPSEIAYQPSNA
jgi:OFA family oxalate/formate antiporter-like MFS transporter